MSTLAPTDEPADISSPVAEDLFKDAGAPAAPCARSRPLPANKVLVTNGGGEILDPFPDAETVAAIERAGAASRAPDPDDFDWAADDSIVLREQPATAIYHNKAGDLVIRQEARWNDDEDAAIFISPANLREFIDRLCDVAGIGSGSLP